MITPEQRQPNLIAKYLEGMVKRVNHLKEKTISL